MAPQITVESEGTVQKITCSEGEILLKVLLANDYEISAYCGGEGICGKCKVKLSGEIRKPNPQEIKFLEQEELEKGYRLSCLYRVNKDLTVHLEAKDEITVMTGSIVTEFDLNMDLSREKIKLSEATLKNQKDYLKRIYEMTNTDNINYENLVKIPELVNDKKISVLSWKDKILDLRIDKGNDKFYGLAVDIGTTTIVIYLLDLKTGEEVDLNSFYNPQKKFGADVISRINYTQNNENGRKEMQEVIIKELNKGIDELTERNQISSNDIYKVSFVGNTIMLHLLLGIDALSIAKAPYVPVFTEELELKADQIGLKINKNGLVQFLPSISGYVGADITGDLLTINIDRLKGNNLMIDIGTNGEIVLNRGEEIYSCSAAAGPAFEGANITFGTAGISGAISDFKIEDKEFKYSTIDQKEPIGICGSGLLDIIAELYKYGFIVSSGKIKEKEELKTWKSKKFKEYKGKNAIKITGEKNSKDIYLTQQDIREVQLAKGAIAAGIEILLKKTNLKAEDLDRVFLAGGFGSYINPDNACYIKMIPDCLKEKIIQIGNGAGTGAKIYLLNKKAKKRAVAIKEKVKYIELSVNKEFQNEYINSMSF
ncbi:MAG: ASKHA domain-containing protein [Halanaerobiales bacterium]